MYEEWVCKRCGMKAWRPKLQREDGLRFAVFPHSLELRKDTGERAMCPDLVERTGKTSPTYVDAVIPPEHYQTAVLAERIQRQLSKRIPQDYHRKPECARAEAVKE